MVAAACAAARRRGNTPCVPRRLVLALLLAAPALLGPGTTPSAAGGGGSPGLDDLRLERIGRFERPVYVTSPPGEPDRLFVVEKAGRIRVVSSGNELDQPFLDISSRVGSRALEQGLLSMAFGPDYERTGRFYVYYSDNSGHIRVDEFHRSDGSPNRADHGTRRPILFQRHPRFVNHYGGQLQFGPDRLLYISTGDGGGAGNPTGTAQRKSSLLGKILRIDPRRSGGRAYSTPGSNPFGRRREVYSFGLRNPYRFSFDRDTGAIIIGDVGQNAVEEIDYARRGNARGANFGWNRFEGSRRFSGGAIRGHVRPVLEHAHSRGFCSIIGGYVVRDRSLGALEGRYIYGDFCRDGLRAARLRPGNARDDRALRLRVGSLSSFGEDDAGHVYAVSLAGGVFRVVAR